MQLKSMLLMWIAVLSIASVQGSWSNCGDTLAAPMFKEFTVFPNPANIGDTIYIRTVVQPDQLIPDGTVQLRIVHNDTDPNNPIVNVPGIPLCNISSAITCPINSTSNVYNWQFVVPAIPAGNYLVRYDIKPLYSTATPGCLVFALKVNNFTAPTTNTTYYTSWYEAVLGGTANFEHTNVDERSIGEIVQVGPSGLLPKSVASGFSYGYFSSVVGSGDLVPAGGLSTANYIWGMSGTMTKKLIQTDSVQHVFEGEFYAGYRNMFATYENSLFSGSFRLTWTWDSSLTQATIKGFFNTTHDSALPSGWPAPILFGRLDHVIFTDSFGSLKARGKKILCTGSSCPTDTTIAAAIVDPGHKSSFSNTQLGVTVGVILGFAFLVVILIAFLTWRKNRREIAEEDGVFAVARKPEYGSALILDDIIQETQGRNRGLRPMLDPLRRPSVDVQDSLSEDDDFGYNLPNDSFSPSRSPSPARSDRNIPRAPAPRRPPPRNSRDDESDDYESDYGRESDESRSRSRSRSPARSRSPTRSRSPSRNFSRSRSPPPRYQSDEDVSSEEDVGSSASRPSDSERSDHE